MVQCFNCAADILADCALMESILSEICGEIVPQLGLILMVQVWLKKTLLAVGVCKGIGQIMRQFSKCIVLPYAPVPTLL